MILQALVLWLAAQAAAAPAPRDRAWQQGRQVEAALDFDVFKTRVQPIFLDKKPGFARCYACHAQGTSFRLQPLAPGATAWTEEQTRQNFDAVRRVVVPGDPAASRLLMMPLAAEAGGDPFHPGGKRWRSKEDPEWRGVYDWIAAASPPAGAGSAAMALDFATYRAVVEPIFLKPRPGYGPGGTCFICHTKVTSRLRLQPVAARGDALEWTEEQSRRNFEVISRLVVPGEPLKSPLLLHPLAAAAGGTPAHAGGKPWLSPDNTEWQAIAAWIRGK